MRLEIGSGKLGRFHAGWHPNELHGPSGHQSKSIDQLFRGQHARLVMRKIAEIFFVETCCPGGGLVGVAVEDGAQEVATIIAAFTKVVRQSVQQGRIAGGIGVPEIIKGLHNPPSHQMRPDPVGLYPGKEGILRPGQPLGEGITPVEGRRHVHHARLRGPGTHFLSGGRMSDFAILLGIDDQFLSLTRLLTFYPVKECRQAVVVVLGPALERMIVTLGALDPGSEEQLGRSLHRIQRVPRSPIVVGSGMHQAASPGGQDLAGKPVVWHVGRHRIHQPAVEFEHGPLPDLSLGYPQEIPPLLRPEGSVFLALEQAVNECRTLLLTLVLHKGFNQLRTGKLAGHVKVDTSKELAIPGTLRRLELQLVQLPIDQLVNVAGRSGITPLEVLDLPYQGQARALDEFQVAHDNGNPATFHSPYQPTARNIRYLGVGALKNGQARHILPPAVAEFCMDRDLLSGLRKVEDPVCRGMNFDSHAGALSLPSKGRPFLDPGA